MMYSTLSKYISDYSGRLSLSRTLQYSAGDSIFIYEMRLNQCLNYRDLCENQSLDLTNQIGPLS